MYAQDENATHTQLYTSHFDLMKMTAGKRSPPIKPLYAARAPAPAPWGRGLGFLCVSLAFPSFFSALSSLQ